MSCVYSDVLYDVYYTDTCVQVGEEHPEFGKLCEVLQDISRKGDVMELKEGLDPTNFLPRYNCQNILSTLKGNIGGEQYFT